MMKTFSGYGMRQISMAVQWLCQYFKVRQHQRQALRELREMSDLELRDLGIGRSELPHVLDSCGQKNRPLE